MSLKGLHILLTYRCTSRCDHCFVWGAPEQTGVFTLAQLDDVLGQAREAGTIEWIYFEGGEPFLFYPVLLHGVRAAAARGFHVGVVTNAYWATTAQDAEAWLAPLAENLASLDASTDELHAAERISAEARNARQTCERLGIQADWIICDLPSREVVPEHRGQAFEGGAIMYRGRAVAALAASAPHSSWDSFDECPHEQLDAPGRVHLDPLGNLHLCQGLLMGNLFDRPLKKILQGYRPDEHPIVAPLLKGGPAELVRRYGLPHDEAYADACHLCFTARQTLRSRFGDVLGPDQMYAEAGS